jgi:hypothetical protein
MMIINVDVIELNKGVWLLPVTRDVQGRLNGVHFKSLATKDDSLRSVLEVGHLGPLSLLLRRNPQNDLCNFVPLQFLFDYFPVLLYNQISFV